MKVTRGVPASISAPRVGQLLASGFAVGGVYESLSKPADWKEVANCVAGRLSELTIRIVTTAERSVDGSDPRFALRFTFVRIGVHPCLHCRVGAASG